MRKMMKAFMQMQMISQLMDADSTSNYAVSLSALYCLHTSQSDFISAVLKFKLVFFTL